MVPPNSFGPPTMVGVVVDFKDRELILKMVILRTIVIKMSRVANLARGVGGQKQIIRVNFCFAKYVLLFLVYN